MTEGILLSLGDVRHSSGDLGFLSYVPVPGSGWCFFDACARQLAVEGLHFRVLACVALTVLALRKAEVCVHIVGDEEELARRSALAECPEYSAYMGELSCFDVYVLDKLMMLL